MIKHSTKLSNIGNTIIPVPASVQSAADALWEPSPRSPPYSPNLQSASLNELSPCQLLLDFRSLSQETYPHLFPLERQYEHPFLREAKQLESELFVYFQV